MAKKNEVNCVPILWNNDVPPANNSMVGTLYRFLRTIRIQSIYAKEPKKISETDKKRDFKIARLAKINWEEREYYFFGHKIIKNGEPGHEKNSKKKYFFVVGFDEMKELTGELKGELAKTA